MKNLYNIGIVALLALLFVQCSSRNESVMVYNDAIVRAHTEIVHDMHDLSQSFYTDPTEEVVAQYAKTQQSIVDGLTLLDDLGNYNGDPSLRVRAEVLFTFYEEMNQAEFEAVVKHLEEAGSPDYIDWNLVDEAVQTVVELEADPLRKFKSEQIAFAQRHDLFLIGSQNR